MPRVARLVVPGIPRHITQRGNNRQDVFFVDDDRIFYLRMLRKYSDENGLEVLGYCLMRDHIHLVAIPSREDSLASAVGQTHFVYTQYINGLHGRSGHLWQNRFYSCALDEEHFWNAMRYVERNPVRAGAASRAWEYRWSSAAVHCGGNNEVRLVDLRKWNGMIGVQDWQAALSAGQNDAAVKELRRIHRHGQTAGQHGVRGEA